MEWAKYGFPKPWESLKSACFGAPETSIASLCGVRRAEPEFGHDFGIREPEQLMTHKGGHSP
eukprot:8688896-Alexandrium_andersonii.AAC.1